MAYSVKLFDDVEDVENFLDSTETYGEEIVDFHTCSYGQDNSQIKYVVLVKEND